MTFRRLVEQTQGTTSFDILFALTDEAVRRGRKGRRAAAMLAAAGLAAPPRGGRCASALRMTV